MISIYKKHFKFTFPSLTCDLEIFEKSLSCQSQGVRLQAEIQTSGHIPDAPDDLRSDPTSQVIALVMEISMTMDLHGILIP